MKIYLRAIFLILSLITSQVSVFAASLNQDASVANNLVCSADSNNIIKWKANGVYQTQFENYFEIDSSYLTKGDVWVCEEFEIIYNPLTYNFNEKLVGTASSTVRNSAPVITPSGALITLNGAPGTPFSYDVDATDADGDDLFYSLSAITPAAAILINPNTGMLTWNNPASGTYLFSVTASDSGYGATSAVQNYRLIISGVAPPPLTLTLSGNPVSGPIPLTVAFTATASGGVAPYNYDWDFTNDGTYDATNVSSSSVQNTNIYSATGSYTARVLVTDSAGVTAQSTVIVSATTTTNTSIIFSTSSCPDAQEDESYTCDIDAAGSGTLEYSLVNEPNGMTIDQNTGVISWLPSSIGDFTFTARVTDVTNLLSRDQDFTVEVRAGDVSEFVFIDSIVFEKETYSPGETAVVYVTVRNEDNSDVDDLKIELLMQDSGVKATSAEFDLMGNGKKTIQVRLDLPSEVSSASEWVKVTLIGENIRIARYRAIQYSGTYNEFSNTFSAKSDKAELLFKPTSLPGYSAGNKDQRLNWAGVWFMIVLVLLLLGLAAYIVKRMAEEKNKVRFNNLDENMF